MNPLSEKPFTPILSIGKISSLAVSILIVIYLVTLVFGLISLDSPEEAIGNPYFTILEVLIILIAPLMIISLAAIYNSTREEGKIYGLIGLVFMVIMTGITCSVHFTILVLSRQPEFNSMQHASLIFSFQWPSIVYALDILAWDFFYPLSMLFLAFLFRGKGLNRTIRVLAFLSAGISFIGLLGIPLNNMQVRNIGILGYTVFAIPLFYLLGKFFSKATE
jgi:hypothetical protein